MSNEDFNDDFHRPEVENLTKNDLVGCLLVVKTISYDGNHSGSFGITQKWTGNVLIVDGPLPKGKVFKDTMFMGLLAEQLGQLGVGLTGVVRVTTGKTRTGNNWVGADFTQDEADIASAKQAVTSANDVPAF